MQPLPSRSHARPGRPARASPRLWGTPLAPDVLGADERGNAAPGGALHRARRGGRARHRRLREAAGHAARWRRSSSSSSTTTTSAIRYTAIPLYMRTIPGFAWKSGVRLRVGSEESRFGRRSARRAHGWPGSRMTEPRFRIQAASSSGWRHSATKPIRCSWPNERARTHPTRSPRSSSCICASAPRRSSASPRSAWCSSRCTRSRRAWYLLASPARRAASSSRWRTSARHRTRPRQPSGWRRRAALLLLEGACRRRRSACLVAEHAPYPRRLLRWRALRARQRPRAPTRAPAGAAGGALWC